MARGHLLVSGIGQTLPGTGLSATCVIFLSISLDIFGYRCITDLRKNKPVAVRGNSKICLLWSGENKICLRKMGRLGSVRGLIIKHDFLRGERIISLRVRGEHN
jgi:hypothetical protein